MNRVYLFLLVSVVMMLFACQSKPKMNIEKQKEQQSVEVDQKTNEIEVDLIDQDGISIGVASLSEEKDGVHIQIDAHHLPEGLHGFHIHENGVCDPPTFESAGAHFNPSEKKHGLKRESGSHNGDMENIEVNADGTVEQQLINDAVTLRKGEKHSLVNGKGTSLIIHADPDDYISQPAGNAGERIVCGVINEGESN